MGAFKRNNPGCPCCGTTTCATLTVTVYGCRGGLLQGATVTVTDGTTTYTGTTGAGGTYTTPALYSATWQWHASYSPRFNTSSNRTITISCPQGNTADSVTLTAATGYVCTGQFTGCTLPIATTLYLTDSATGNTVTLSYDTINDRWSGSDTWTGFGGCSGFPGCPARNVYLNYYVPGAGATTAQLDWGSEYSGGFADGCPGTVPTYSSTFSGTTSSTCPTPFSWSASGTWTTGGGIVTGHPYNTTTCSNNGGSTWTVTE